MGSVINTTILCYYPPKNFAQNSTNYRIYQTITIYVLLMTKTQVHDPISLFRRWFEEAQRKGNFEPTACAVATADAEGHPSVRMVLLKKADKKGMVFYTNRESRKGRDLDVNRFAALLFHWQNPHRQVRVEGLTLPVSEEEADKYFATRHRESQIGAWASAQSRPMKNRLELKTNITQQSAKFSASVVPRPPYWLGYRITPKRIEFWQEKKFRLHERTLYELDENLWIKQKLFP